MRYSASLLVRYENAVASHSLEFAAQNAMRYRLSATLEFGLSGVLIVRYLCSVPNLVQISVIVTEIDAHMLQTFI